MEQCSKGINTKDYFRLVINHLAIGLVMTFLGLLPPGMMNMTVVRHALSNGMTAARQFGGGAALIVGLQSMIALSFAEWLLSNPDVVDGLRKFAVIVFLVLAFYFYRLSRKTMTFRSKDTAGKFFLGGMAMSSLNMLAIPFFLGYSTIMNINGWLQFAYPQILFFVLGAMMGSFSLFMVYAKFSRFVSERVSFIAANINLILAILFVILAMISVYSLHLG